MLRSIRPCRAIRAFAPFVALLAFSSAGFSQTKEMFPTPPEPKNRSLVEALRDGGQTLAGAGPTLALTAEQKTALLEVAEYTVRRVALAPFNGEPMLKDTKVVVPGSNDNVSYLAAEVTKMVPKSQQKDGSLLPTQIVYSKEMAAAIRKIIVSEILTKPVRPIVRVNSVRLLSLAAKIPDAGWIDDFMKILRNDRETGAVKLYALQGLSNALALNGPTDATRAMFEDTVVLKTVNDYLQGFIAKPLAEILTDNDRMVARYLRREAIVALGQFRQFSIREPGTGVLLATPGLMLLRIANGTLAVVPELGGPEQIEALVALLAMKPDARADLKVVSYGIAAGTLEVLTYLGGDKKRIAAGEASTPKVVSLPETTWKIVGARISENVRNMEVALQTPELRTVAGSQDLGLLAKSLAKVGPTLEKDGYKAQVAATELDNWKNTRRPAGDKLIVLPGDKIPSDLEVR